MSRNKHKRKEGVVGIFNDLLRRHTELTSPFVSLTSYAALGVERPDVEELELSTAVQEQALASSGLPLLQALQQSTFLYRAARRYTPTAMLVTDGIRFWTSDLNFNGMYTEELSLPLLQHDPVWRPVIGSEAGWRLA